MPIFALILITFEKQVKDAKRFKVTVEATIQKMGAICVVMSLKNQLDSCLVELGTDYNFDNEKAIKICFQQWFPKKLILKAVGTFVGKWRFLLLIFLVSQEIMSLCTVNQSQQTSWQQQHRAKASITERADHNKERRAIYAALPDHVRKAHNGYCQLYRERNWKEYDEQLREFERINAYMYQNLQHRVCDGPRFPNHGDIYTCGHVNITF